MNRSFWVDADTWCDPDCIECGGEGAPCCEPPDWCHVRQAPVQPLIEATSIEETPDG